MRGEEHKKINFHSGNILSKQTQTCTILCVKNCYEPESTGLSQVSGLLLKTNNTREKKKINSLADFEENNDNII